MILGDVDVARRSLSQRTDAKEHLIAVPALLIDGHDGKACGRPRQTSLETARRLRLAEAVRDGNDERCGHVTGPQPGLWHPVSHGKRKPRATDRHDLASNCFIADLIDDAASS